MRAVSPALAGLALLAATIACPARASTAAEAAQDARVALEAATADLIAAQGARDRVSALSATIRAYEDGLAALRDALRRAALRETALRRDFDAKSARIAQLLGVLSALERTEGPLLLLHPSGPVGTAQSAMLLADVTPALAAEAEVLRAQLQEIALIRALQDSAAQTLEDGLRAVQSARTALSQAIADRRDLPPRAADDTAMLAALANGAETLDAFARNLAELPLSGSTVGRDAEPGFSAARGALPLPVQGVVLRRADETDAAGVRRPGLLLATRPRALVTAPWPATIRYSGPLLDYGNVMVLDPGEGYLMVLAGLDIVYGVVGEVVSGGAPVGLMGGQDAQGIEFVAAAAEVQGGTNSETLYVELRQGTNPVDPGDWFTLTRE
jgi:septal ring factor EnvC (AmiA/AmiB activator)